MHGSHLDENFIFPKQNLDSNKAKQSFVQRRQKFSFLQLFKHLMSKIEWKIKLTGGLAPCSSSSLIT